MIRVLAGVAAAITFSLLAPALAQQPDEISRLEAQTKARGEVLSDLYEDLRSDIFDADREITPELQKRIDAALATEGEVRRFARDLYEADGAVSGLDARDGRTRAIPLYASMLDALMLANSRNNARLKEVMLRRLTFLEAVPLPSTSNNTGALDCSFWDPVQGSESLYASVLDDPAYRGTLLAIFARLEARGRRCELSNGVPPDAWRQVQVMIGRIHAREGRYAEAYAAGEAAYRATLRDWQAIGILDGPTNAATFRMAWMPVRLGQLIAADAMGNTAAADEAAADVALTMRDDVANPLCAGDPTCRLFMPSTGPSLDPAIALAGLPAARAMQPLKRLQRAFEKLMPGAAAKVKFELGLANRLADQPDESLADTFRKRGLETARANMANDWKAFGAPLLDFETDTALRFGGDVAAAKTHYDALVKAAPPEDKSAALLLRANRMVLLLRDEDARGDYKQALALAQGTQRFEALLGYGDFLWRLRDYEGARAHYALWLDEVTPEKDENSIRGVVAWSQAQAMLAMGDVEAARSLAALWATKMRKNFKASSVEAGHEYDGELRVLVRDVGRIEVFDAAGETHDRRCARAVWELEMAPLADSLALADDLLEELSDELDTPKAAVSDVGAPQAVGTPPGPSPRTNKVPDAAERMRNAETYCPDPGEKFSHRIAIARAEALIDQKDEAGVRKSLGPLSGLHFDDVTPLQMSAERRGMTALAAELSELEDKLRGSFVDDSMGLFAEDDRRCQGALLDTVASELAAQAGDGRAARAGLEAAVNLCDDGDFFASTWFPTIGTGIRIRLGELAAAREEMGPLEDLEIETSAYFEALARQAGAYSFADELVAAQEKFRLRRRDRS